jgi:nitrous oxide reductase
MTQHDDSTPLSRRRFLAGAALVAAAPLLLRVPAARAAGLPPLPPTNPQAKALGYVADASKTTHAAHKPGSVCANCQFFQAGTSGCALFAGFSVAPKGWCSAWAKKAG